MLIKKILRQIADGIAAGLLITIGCCVFLACNDIKWVGAILFSVALLTICYKGYSLYTGRIGFILENANKDYFSALFLGLLGNVIATAVVGIAVQYAIPNLHTTALALCTAKFEQLWWQTLIRGIMCGVLMYVAVAIYKEKKSVVGVLFAIPVFILSGFEHSIADMGYFAIGGIYSAKAFGFIWLVILGNSIGALILPALGLVGKTVKKDKEPEKALQNQAENDENSVENQAENIEKTTENLSNTDEKAAGNNVKTDENSTENQSKYDENSAAIQIEIDENLAKNAEKTFQKHAKNSEKTAKNEGFFKVKNSDNQINMSDLGVTCEVNDEE